ncbi:MAG: carboxypeptidase-like regulatory domain-containing protein [Candidatus Sulfotelmatobacter sp.]
MRIKARVVTRLVGFLLAVSALTLAQNATTSLRGTVYDAKGAVVAGASVTLTNPATGFVRSAKSDGQGAYQFLELPPAKYDLIVNAVGFAELKQSGLELQVATPATLNVNLQVTGGTVTVEVNSSAPLVNTQDASMGHAFGADQIADLPFEGRDPAGILSLQTGVVFTGNSTHIASASDSRAGSVNGARSDQTNITLDGVDNNDELLGTAFTGAIREPLDAVQDLKVTTSNSDADAGRSSGGQVSEVTKSGTNRFHGSLYAYNRPTFTTANDWFNKAAQIGADEPNTAPFLLRNTFGANIGGPIIKDRLFFFAAYEGQRKREDLQVTRVVPSLGLRAGNMSYPCDSVDDTVNCVASNPNVQTINGTLIATLNPSQIASMDPNCSGNGTCPLGPGANPLVAYLQGNPNSSPGSVFNLYPQPNTETVGDGLDFQGFTFPSPLPSSLNDYVFKLDYNLTKNGNHTLFVKGIMDNEQEAERNVGTAYTITGDGGEEFPGQPEAQTEHDNNKGITVGYTATLSSTLINNFHFGYISQLINISGLQTQPYVDFRGMDNIYGFTPTINTHVPVKNIVDDVTKVKGSHILQFGGNYRQIDNLRESNEQNFFGALTNVYWLNVSGISNTGSSLDPAAFGYQSSATGDPNLGYPAVDPNFGANYDFAMAALTGLITQVNANYELTKNLNVIPQGELVPRHFRNHEYEIYGQDQWKLKPNLTVTYGLRYTILQPPYETTGTQVSPTISLHDWFNQRGAAAAAGQVYNPMIGFQLSGQANGKQPYWSYDYKDFAPRFAFAYSPTGDTGLSKWLWGGQGKTSIRAGYGLYFDHFGEGITNTFDREGSFGLTTAEVNPAGIQTVDGSARYSGLYTIPTSSNDGCNTPPCSLVGAPPTGPFPVYSPSGAATPGGFAITWGLDDKLKTPYSHVIDFSITRELPSNFVFEASYVGRMAHRLLQEEDLAEPTNLRDPASNTTYFQAAQALARNYYKGTPIQNISAATIGTKYWENVFPGAAGPSSSQLGVATNNVGTPCGPSQGAVPGNVTATQAMYDLFACFEGNETTALELADAFCLPNCSTLAGQAGPTPYNFYSQQFSSMDAWRSIGSSNYNAGQFSLRHRSGGLEFDLNYTYSRSIDDGSNAERVSTFEGGGFASQIINSWLPQQNRAVSDFDTTHIVNANWVYQLPFGRGKHFGSGMGRVADSVIGGWTLSGLWRWSTGYPFSLISPEWATNYDLETPAVPVSSARPKTGSFIVAQSGGGTGPNVFQDPGITDASTNPNAAINLFRPAYPGEGGLRNGLRGPGTFDIDTTVTKSWAIKESQLVKLSWSMFNVTNSARFDVGTMQLNGNDQLSASSSFGNFSSTLSNPRVMEFMLRYIF